MPICRAATWAPRSPRVEARAEVVERIERVLVAAGLEEIGVAEVGGGDGLCDVGGRLELRQAVGVVGVALDDRAAGVCEGGDVAER